jgi:hypothetical protein
MRFFVYYESIKREIQRRPIYECRSEERLKIKTEGSTHLVYTGFVGGLEHLKIVVYYEVIKREIYRRTDGFTLLTYTGLCGNWNDRHEV